MTASFHTDVRFQKKSIPTEGHWKFLGGGGSLQAKILEAKYKAKLKFPGGKGEGRGCKTETFQEGVWIFSETTQLEFKTYSLHQTLSLIFITALWNNFSVISPMEK